MSDPRDSFITQTLTRHDQNAIYEDWLGGDISSDLNTGLADPYVWVNLDVRGHTAVWNTRVANNTPGLGVLTAINRRSGQREVVDHDYTRSISNGVPSAIALSASTPAKTGEASDVASVSLQMGRVEPFSGLTVFVRPLIYNGLSYTTLYDLSSIESGLTTDTKQMSILGFDTATLTFTLTSGNERALAYPFDAANALLEAESITTDDTVIRLGAVAVTESGTTLAWSDVTDIREWLRPIAPGSQSWFPQEKVITSARTIPANTFIIFPGSYTVAAGGSLTIAAGGEAHVAAL